MKRFVSTRLPTDNGLEAMMAASEAASDGGIIDLSLGDPDLDTDETIIRAAFEDAATGFTHYAPALGDPELLAEIRSVWAQDYGVAVGTHEVIVTASGCHAMWLLLTAVLDPGDEVVVFSPYFPPYPDQIRLAGGVPVFVETDPDEGFVPTATALEAVLGPKTKAVIVNTPCNPTGVCLTREQMEPLARVCVEHDLLLIADDIYTTYSFETPFYAFAQIEGVGDNLATIKSFSKDYCMSGWRVGYVVAPPATIEAMRKVNESNVFSAPIVSQRAALHALRDRVRIRALVHDTYGARMAYVQGRLESIEGVSAPSSRGSLYLFPDIRATGLTDKAFTARLLEEAGISVIPGSAFGSAGEGFLRMALRVDEKTLATVFDAVERIAESCR